MKTKNIDTLSEQKLGLETEVDRLIAKINKRMGRVVAKKTAKTSAAKISHRAIKGTSKN